MLINVPQYIDVEDKIAGPLTAKQLFWMIGLGIILLILWNVVSKPIFFILAIPLALLFVALAFYRPYGQSLGSFLMFGILYFFKPKVYVWRRLPEKIEPVRHREIEKKKIENKDKKLTQDQLRNISKLLDSEGQQYDPTVVNILKQQKRK